MKLLTISPNKALGTLLAHSLNVDLNGQIKRFKKGLEIRQNHIYDLNEANICEIAVAQLEEGDVPENQAAQTLADALAACAFTVDAAFTGRSNLYAKSAGLFLPNIDRVNALNAVHPSITVATLPEHARVSEGQMVATLKIIPFAVKDEHLTTCLKIIQEDDKVLRVAQFTPHRVGLIATTLPHVKEGTYDKTRRVLEERLARSSSRLIDEFRWPHEVTKIAEALEQPAIQDADLIIMFGASAIIDEHDVLPEGVRRAGGKIEYVGMPVDPGNLIFIGSYKDTPVIGAPGCARSSADNGFDRVLDLLLSGLNYGPSTIQKMGVGGLLKEIHSRPQLREPLINDPVKPSIEGLVLAAGQSRRMGEINKLLVPIDDKPMVAHVVEAATSSHLDKTTIVTGMDADLVTDALSTYQVRFVRNPDYETGLASSLNAGLVEIESDGVLVLLGDMPTISAGHINALIDAFDPNNGQEIIVPTFLGKRGNPVLWSKRFYQELQQIKGDTGGRHLIGKYAEFLHEVEIGEAARLDIDTPEALAQAQLALGPQLVRR